MKWKCKSCGFEENTGKFCDNCGAPPGGFPQKKEPAASLEEARSRKEKHGTLLECEYSSYTMGMAVNSYVGKSLMLKKEGGGFVLEEREIQQGVSETLRLFRADRELYDKLAALVERENLAAWESLKEKPEMRIQIFDYSAGSTVSLKYDDSSVGGPPSFQAVINCTAAEHHGGGSVIKELQMLLRSAAVPERLVVQKTKPTPPIGMGMGMGMQPVPAAPGAAAPGNAGASGTGAAPHVKPGEAWTCPACGEKGITGKFCYNCGAARP